MEKRAAADDDAKVVEVVERLYDEYKVEPGVRVAPAVVNAERREHQLLEKLVRSSYYGTASERPTRSDRSRSS